jgi:hypothetical protein
MADFINVAESGEFVQVDINASGTFANADTAMADTGNVMTVPSLQEITVNATPGIFRWKQLDTLSEKVVTTASTNNIESTFVLDPVTFFDGTGSTSGIFDIVNNKTLCYFRMYWQGTTSGDKYIEGSGYLSALAPTVSPDSPVWTSPVTIEVVGDFTSGSVA